MIFNLNIEGDKLAYLGSIFVCGATARNHADTAVTLGVRHDDDEIEGIALKPSHQRLLKLWVITTLAIGFTIV